MAGGVQHEDDLIASINVTPLVDIILVLLIIFMVTTEVIHEAERPRVLAVQLPAAASAEQMLAEGLLSIVIDAKGDVWLNGEPSGTPAIAAAIARIGSAGKPAQALISADERVSHGVVVELMDFLRGQGVSDMAINTKRQAIE